MVKFPISGKCTHVESLALRGFVRAVDRGELAKRADPGGRLLPTKVVHAGVDRLQLLLERVLGAVSAVRVGGDVQRVVTLVQLGVVAALLK